MIIGCSDKPNILGIGLIPPQDSLKTFSTVAEATSDTAFLYRVKGILSTLVGFYSDIPSNTSQESRALLQFEGFTVIPDTARIVSAFVKIPINYKFKNSTGKLKLNIHSILKSWDQKTFIWDSCVVESFYGNTPDTTFSKDIDTSDNILKIDVTPFVRRWVREKTNTPNGIIIIPDTLRSDMILGTRSNADTLEVTYYETDTSTVTKTISTNPIQQTFIANGAVPQSNTVRYIQAGISYRELIRFDISSIPHRASITQATFEITSDENSSVTNSYSHDSLFVYLVRNDTLPYTSIALGTVCSKSSDGSRTIYSTDIKAIVQQWVVREPNYGLILRPYAELSSFDRFAIYRTSSQDSLLRPKLKIKYTVLP